MIEAWKAYNEARKAWDEAWKAYNEAYKARDEACKACGEARKAWDEVCKAWDEVVRKNWNAIVERHKIECPGCPFDYEKKTLIFPN